MDIPTNSFGPDGPPVTRVGLGGEGVLRTHGREGEAKAVIEAALEQGLTYFDSAAAYAGSQGYYGLVWGATPGRRAGVFQTSKSAMRDEGRARAELENTLTVMNIDRLDLWQIHDVRTEQDYRAIEGPGGALEAFVRAREEGLTRYIGVTGHHDPEILTRAATNWPVDAVLLPINPAEAVVGGFLDRTMSAAQEKGLAVIGMKVLGAGQYVRPESGLTAQRLIRFALTYEPTLVIAGCKSPDEVNTLAAAGAETRPLPAEEKDALISAFQPHARNLAYYRGVF